MSTALSKYQKTASQGPFGIASCSLLEVGATIVTHLVKEGDFVVLYMQNLINTREESYTVLWGNPWVFNLVFTQALIHLR